MVETLWSICLCVFTTQWDLNEQNYKIGVSSRKRWKIKYTKERVEKEARMSKTQSLERRWRATARV